MPISFDPTDTDTQIGIEVEWPRVSDGKPMVSRGRESDSLRRSMDPLPPNMHSRVTYDGTVGLEIVSDTLNLADAANWYKDIIEYMRAEYNEEYQPTGLLSSGSTAGTHIHLSPLSRQQAQDLFELSQQPWAQVLFCSSIATENDSATWPVFRGGRYCQWNFDNGHYSAVNSCAGSGHYEWRMPEPMLPQHMEIVAEFLYLFTQNTDLAIEYAQEVLDDADDRITSIQRAEAVGMDIDEMPSVRRDPAPVDSENFYQTIANEPAAPEIHHVQLDGDDFYVLNSSMDYGRFELGGYELEPNDVLYADSLDRPDDVVRDEVERAFQRQHENIRETEATNELKKIVKKKKGKPVDDVENA